MRRKLINMFHAACTTGDTCQNLSLRSPFRFFGNENFIFFVFSSKCDICNITVHNMHTDKCNVFPVKYGRETEEQIFNNLQLVLRTLVSRELPFRKSHKDNAKQNVLIRDIEYAHRSPITSAVKANFVHEIYTS